MDVSSVSFDPHADHDSDTFVKFCLENIMKKEQIQHHQITMPPPPTPPGWVSARCQYYAHVSM